MVCQWKRHPQMSVANIHLVVLSFKQYDVDLAADIIIKKLQKAILSDKSANVATSDEKSSEDDSEDVKEDGDPV